MQTLIGKKTVQTQAFLTNGTRIPVTILALEDMPVLAVKTADKHGYAAIQVGFGTKKKPGKALMGAVKKANITKAPALLRELKLTDDSTIPAVGDTLKAEDVLKAGDVVKATGISKGKGFAGVVKRHNFRGGPRTHGQSDRERAPGSIGQTTTPGRVYRGKRMAGHMGHEKVSVTNLVVMDISVSGGKKTLILKGLVPGSVNTIITLEKTGELSEKKFVPLHKIEEPTVAEEVTAPEVSEAEAEVTVMSTEAEEMPVAPEQPSEAPAAEKTEEVKE